MAPRLNGASRPILNQARLKELVRYDRKTGVFYWLVRRNRVRADVGMVAGCARSTDGYHAISIDGQKYLSHRLAWLYETGEWPNKAIDHIDGNKSNNAISNLREASPAQNAWNMRLSHDRNTSGAKCVYWYKPRRKWAVRICVNGARKYVGLFSSKDDAEIAAVNARKELHGEFGRDA